MIKHYVTFYSPGTFVAETSTKEVPSWDVNLAIQMAHDITERYNATPYGFQFSTRERGDSDFDPKETKRSCTYYLGGKVETLEQVMARKDGDNEILISNMKGNGWKRIITNDNSWRWTQPLDDDDVVLQFKPRARKKALGA